MSYTWHDIKLACLQKMFSSTGTTIQIDSSTKEYVESMPQAANEGLQLLSTAKKFILKSRQIIVQPVKNLLGDSFEKQYVTNGEVVYTSAEAKSYYFTVQGKHIHCTLTVGEGDPIVIKTPTESGYLEDDTIESDERFAVFKGNIENPDKETVTLKFMCDYPFHVRNVCFYEYSYPSDDDVPPYEEYIHYYLPDMMESFYQLSENDLYYEGKGKKAYIPAEEYYQEADRTLVIPRSKPGIYTVYYKAYPTQITQDTEDDYVMELDPEVAAILPLYMASQLYKDDDNAIATVYRNEFEIAYERLTQAANIQRKEEFVSESGWC